MSTQEFAPKVLRKPKKSHASFHVEQWKKSVSASQDVTASAASAVFIDQYPHASLAGKYDDEPLWDDYIAAIQEYRQELNEKESTTEQTRNVQHFQSIPDVKFEDWTQKNIVLRRTH